MFATYTSPQTTPQSTLVSTSGAPRHTKERGGTAHLRFHCVSQCLQVLAPTAKREESTNLSFLLSFSFLMEPLVPSFSFSLLFEVGVGYRRRCALI